MGTPNVKLPAIPAAPPTPDLTDDAVLQARRAQMRTVLARRGLQSTFSNGAMGNSTLLGGGKPGTLLGGGG